MRKAFLRGLCLGRVALAFALVFAVCALFPAPVRAAGAPPEVGAGAYVVMDAATGQVLVSKNMDARGYPASITKIITLGLVLENVDLDAHHNDVITTSDAAVDALIPRASMIALGRGEQATLCDLLYATMLESANDAANVLAEYAAGSMEGFAQMMNEKAAVLGLGGSHFVNPSGQPEDEHYTTARDMATALRWALGVKGFRQIFTAQEYQMGATNMQPGGRVFHNANLASVPGSAYYYPGVVGSKTGFTDQARYTLATAATRRDMELICVVLDCPTNSEKYTSTSALLDYCFNNFRRVSISAAGIPAHSVPVFGGGENSLGQIDVFAEEKEIGFLLHNSLSPTGVSIACEVPEKYVLGETFAPTATVLLENAPQQDGAVLATVNLVWSGLDEILAQNTSLAGTARRMAQEKPLVFWLVVFALCLVLGLVLGRIVLVQTRQQRRRKRRLAAARAQLPIQIAPRPRPPSLQNQPSRPARSPSTPRLRVSAQAKPPAYPRRAGRMR